MVWRQVVDLVATALDIRPHPELQLKAGHFAVAALAPHLLVGVEEVVQPARVLVLGRKCPASSGVLVLANLGLLIKLHQGPLVGLHRLGLALVHLPRGKGQTSRL